MTRRRKILLIILVSVLLANAGIYWQPNRINNDRSAIEKLNKEIARDLSELRKMMIELGAVMENEQQLPLPNNGVNSSYHDGGYEDSLVQDLDQKTGLVLVTTVDSKMTIVFKPTYDNFQKFHVGWRAPVTFQCTKIHKGKCDFMSPYKLFVGNGLVEVKQLIFPEK